MLSSTAAPLLSISTSEMSDLSTSMVLRSVLPPTKNSSVCRQAHPERNCFIRTGTVIEMNGNVLTLMSFGPRLDDLILLRYSSY